MPAPLKCLSGKGTSLSAQAAVCRYVKWHSPPLTRRRGPRGRDADTCEARTAPRAQPVQDIIPIPYSQKNTEYCIDNCDTCSAGYSLTTLCCRQGSLPIHHTTLCCRQCRNALAGPWSILLPYVAGRALGQSFTLKSLCCWLLLPNGLFQLGS